MLEQFSHWLGEWADRRRTLVALQRLDRRLLADIGVPEDRLEEFADPRARARIIEIERENGHSRTRVGASRGSFAKIAADGEEPFDLFFLDADKPNNPAYFGR